MKKAIIITKPHGHFAYFTGDRVTVAAETADTLIKQGCAVEAVEETETKAKSKAK